MKKGYFHNTWLLTPLIGCCLFILLYIIAAFLYPGGSNEDQTAKGFSVLHNYWCELLASQARNGAYNPGWLVAMWAMGVLCLAVAVFWWLAPRLFERNRWHTILISYAGTLSMGITPFLSTQYHDLILNLASIPGIIAMLTTFIALYKHGRYNLFALGVFCLLLVGINNYIYCTGNWLYTLPVLQKITFLLVMTWMSTITWIIYSKEKRQIRLSANASN